MLRLKELRLNRGKTQSDIAELLGITRPAYTRYENSEREPDIKALRLLSEYYNVSVDYLLGREEQPTRSLDEQLDGVEFAMLDGARGLSDEGKKAVLTYIKFLEQQEKEGK